MIGCDGWGIEFGRGAFENPDDPMHDDDVDSTIVVVTAAGDRDAARAAVERCRERWWGIDGAGRFHGADDLAFWEAQPDNDGPEWHTAKYVSDVEVVDDGGIAVGVDCQGLMPAAMRAAHRDVLVEELRAAGVIDAEIRSRHHPDDEPVPEHPTGPGSWPPYADSAVPGLPPGIPPGRVIHHELRQRSDFRNRLLGRSFGSVWQASAMAVADRDEDAEDVEDAEEEAVRRVRELFRDAGWAVGELQTTVDGNRRPLTATAMTIPGAIALVTGQAARHARGPGRRLPDDARHVVAVAYYDIEPPA